MRLLVRTAGRVHVAEDPLDEPTERAAVEPPGARDGVTGRVDIAVLELHLGEVEDLDYRLGPTGEQEAVDAVRLHDTGRHGTSFKWGLADLRTRRAAAPDGPVIHTCSPSHGHE